MKQKLLFFLSIFAFSAVAYAQTRTVTNFDLEKYKERRVQAEQGLKEYYAKHGVTEEDLAKREAEENRSREELSARLRTTRLAEEHARYEQKLRARAASTQVNLVIGQQPQGYVYPGYYYYGNRWYPRTRGQGHFGNGVQWRATPMGVIYEPGSRPSTIWGPPTPAPRIPAWRPARNF